MKSKTYDEFAYLYNSEDHKDMLRNKYCERYSLYSFFNPEKKSILELGVSAGIIAKHCILNGAINYIGIDFSPKMINYANHRNRNNFMGIVADLSEPQDLEGKFDIIISSLTLHYIKNWKNVYNIFDKNLTKNGEIIIQIHNPALISKLYRNVNHNYLIKEVWKKDSRKMRVCFYQKEIKQIKKELNNIFFKIVEIKGSSVDPITKIKHPKFYKKLTIETEPHYILIRIIRNL